MMESKPPMEPPKLPTLKEKLERTQGPYQVQVKDPFTKDASKRKDEKEQLLKELVEIVRDYRSMESDIPTTHVYWQKLNHFRAL